MARLHLLVLLSCLLGACVSPGGPPTPREVRAASLTEVERLVMTGRHADALELSRKALLDVDSARDRAELHLLRARAHLGLDQDTSALSQLALAHAALPRSERDDELGRRILTVWGDLEVRMGRTASATRRYEEALAAGDVSPREADDLRYRLYVALRTTDPTRAEHWKRQVRLPSSTALAKVEAALTRRAPPTRVPPPVVAPAAPVPTSVLADVRPRSTWNAQPSRSNSDPMGTITTATVHHSVGWPDSLSRTVIADYVRELQRQHQEDNGWADIGYHFLVDPVGGVWEGRPLSIQGAHAGRNKSTGQNYNVGNVGICLLGDFRSSAVPAAQRTTLVRMLDALKRQHPGLRVKTHQEFVSTECPGGTLQSVVDLYRDGGASVATLALQ